MTVGTCGNLGMQEWWFFSQPDNLELQGNNIGKHDDGICLRTCGQICDATLPAWPIWDFSTLIFWMEVFMEKNIEKHEKSLGNPTLFNPIHEKMTNPRSENTHVGTACDHGWDHKSIQRIKIILSTPVAVLHLHTTFTDHLPGITIRTKNDIYHHWPSPPMNSMFSFTII